MPTPRTLMPPLRPNDEFIRLNGNISLSDKRTVLSACADDGILNLISAYAFKHTAEFIRHYGIVSYDPAKFALLSDFICNRTDPRVVGTAPIKYDTGATPSGKRKTPPTPSVASPAGQSRPGRTGLKTGEVAGSGD